MLGAELARALGVKTGDRITLVAPGGQVTPAGVVPRLKQFTLVGTFDAGHYEYDSGLALIHVDDAARLFRVEGPTGVQLRLADLHQARAGGAPARARAWPGGGGDATGRAPTATGSPRCSSRSA